jgi:hypothetical protein
MEQTLEQTAMRKVYMRLLPFSVLCMFVCYLDRVNVGFAALTMNKDLGLSAYFFGLGAGAFYGGYCLFEVPSNLVLERVGARFWIARIMITWGLLAGAMAFVRGPISFVTLRFLLGAAEAGFFPGILFYFHYWFPMRHRGRMISWFTVATPISVALGGPISTGLLGLDGAFGLAGWQWVFITEAAPAVILGFVVLIYLRDRPTAASWLTPEEKEWLTTELAQERRELEAVRTYTLFQSLTNIRVLALAVIYFGIVTASVGLVLFVPQIIKQLTRRVEPGDRFPDDDPLRRRNRQHDRLGLRLRPDAGAPMEPLCRLPRRRRWADRGRVARRKLLVARRNVPRDDRFLRLEGTLLAAPVDLPHWHRCGRRYGADQLGRQRRRLLRAVCRGLDQGQHGKLR